VTMLCHSEAPRMEFGFTVWCSLLFGHSGEHVYERGDGVEFAWPNAAVPVRNTPRDRQSTRYYTTPEGRRALAEARGEDLALTEEEARDSIAPLLALVLAESKAAGMTPSAWVRERLRVGPAEGWKC
jgi:hypothetical protein